MTDTPQDVLAEAPDEPIVHWMERPPMMVRPAALAVAVGGAFVLGLLTGVGLAAAMQALGDADA